MANYRRRQSIPAFVAVVVAGSLLFAFAATKTRFSSSSFVRNDADGTDSLGAALQGNSDHRRRLASLSLAKFTDPKKVERRPKKPLNKDAAAVVKSDAAVPSANQHFTPIDHESRANCQIVYILGVEGATHHGFIPILEKLAKHQTDPRSGLPYTVDAENRPLKAGLFGWFYHTQIKKWGFHVTPEVDDPDFVRKVVAESCPDDGTKHVLIEWASFPSGHEDDPRSYRVHRQHDWLDMTPEEIANTEEALSHPLKMNAFYQAYSPYVDIKFVVLHRPFLETIASHRDWDGGPPTHSNIIRGFMLMLRRFLDMHVFDLVTGSRLWSLVCVERIMAKNYDNPADADAARLNVMGHLAKFLGWPNGDCTHCFDEWMESTKDPIVTLGKDNVEVLRDHMVWLEGVWPPPGEEGVAEQQCGI